MAAVRLLKVSKSFGTTRVLHDVDLEIADGDFCCFVGPSGCGKSTLLRLIAGLEDVTGGDLEIGGQRVNNRPPAQRGVAMVFQSYALYPHMTAYQNMAFGLKLARTEADSVRERVLATARLLHIDNLLDRLPRQLSGGQRQRVAIGRAIVRQPRVFLFDEPLSNLDAALRTRTRVEIARLHARLGSTMIYVTHDQVEAMTLANRIVVLRQGRVEQVGSPLALYHHPVNTFVAGFIGSPQMNFLEARLQGNGAAGAQMVLSGGAAAQAAVDTAGAPSDTKVTLGIRPEHVVLGSSAGSTLAGRVEFSEQLGDHNLVYLRLEGADELFTAKVRPHTRLRDGATVSIRLLPEDCHLFDQNGVAYRRLVSPGETAQPDPGDSP
ncbi:MAG: sn-glycerol-3-phosphate ABC transporter ATP-binding protein UgpC [Pseudomonadota bacterium]